MIELPNPFDPNSEMKSITVEPTPPVAPLIQGAAAASRAFPRGFDPERFLAEVESPPTSDARADQIHEDEIVRIVKALARLAGRYP